MGVAGQEVLANPGKVVGALGEAPFAGVGYVVLDHRVDVLDPVSATEHLEAHFGGNNERDVFVFGNGLHFLRVEFTKFQTFFQAQHDNLQQTVARRD